MDPVGPWSAYASYNRLAGVQATTTTGELHHHLTPGGSSTSAPPSTTAQILQNSFLTPPPVGYDSVFTPLFHHANAKPHYVTQHRQALAQAAASKQTDGDYHQAQAFFEQNPGAWQQNGPFGILPHESVVATTSAKNSYENFNAHFTAQSLNHLNSLKNASIRAPSPHTQVVTTISKPQPNPSFFQAPPTTFTTTESPTNNKPYPATNSQNLQQSCIVTSSNVPTNPTTKEYRLPQAPTRPAFLPTNVVRMEKSFAPSNTKPTPTSQIQTKAQTKIYSDINNPVDRHRSNDEQNQQSSPISFSIMDTSRLNYANNNNGNKRPFQTNYRHYPQNTNENDFQRNKDFNNTNGPDCNVIVPRRPSPLQAHSQASPIGHAPSPAYPLYNSPMNSTIASPQNSTNQVTPPSPLDVSVPRPNSQTNIPYPSVITRALNTEKTYPERFDRNNQNCWDDRRKYNNNFNTTNSIEIPSRQIDVPSRTEPPQRQTVPLGISERQQVYFDSSNHQVTLQDLSSCRGDPMSIVKNLQQQQQICTIQQTEVKQEIKATVKRRKSGDKVVNDIPGRLPPPAHTSGGIQQPQNGAYFDFDRWNLPPPGKMFSPQSMQQHQGIMVPHPHSHHPPPPLPYFPSFHLPPHPPEFPATVEITPMGTYSEQNSVSQPLQYQQPDDQPKVVVPNIEEELNFLSVATAPVNARPPAIQQSKAINPPTIAKPNECKPGSVGFMSSYIKFLQGERDSSPPPANRGGRKHTWTRNKSTESMPELNGNAPPVVQPIKPPPPKRLSQGDPQDDPRYFPLPKERKRFDSSDDGLSSEEDLFNKKVPTVKEPTTKEKTGRKGRPCKPGGPTERKRAKLAKKKEIDKAVVIPKIIESENIPRRESSKRAAKEKVQIKGLGGEEVEDTQEFIDSDSDPAWTPAAKEPDDDELPIVAKKGKRGRPSKKTKQNLLNTAAKNNGNDTLSSQTKKQKAVNNKAQKQGNSAPTLEDNIAAAVAKQNSTMVTNPYDELAYKPGEFVVIESDLHNHQWPAIWRVDGKTLLQKYEPFHQPEGTLYKNISTYTSWTPENKKQYITIPVRYRSQSQMETIVEFIKQELIITDPAHTEILMKQNMVYQDNFEVYVQTLISQALDSNFLTEIFQEQDDYFLSNVKIIDDVSASKKQLLINTLRWPPPLHIAVSTWPCYNVIKEFSNSDLLSRNCDGCGLAGVAVRVLMYGQPYNITTLEGCQLPRSANEKDFIICRICANRIELYSKVAHQKYLTYVECAKRVTDKRTTDPSKDTTCILNELLADEKWLGQLFASVRNCWAEIDSIAHSFMRVHSNSQ